MSFNIKLQKCTSPANFVTKTVTDIVTVTGVLKDASSIIDPVITIQKPVGIDIMSDINYCDIESFGRKYYITNIVSISDALWEIHCHVDVLMTYASQIRRQNAIVARQENKFNMNLDDGWFMAYQDPLIFTHYLSVAAPFEHQEFVLVVAGS